MFWTAEAGLRGDSLELVIRTLDVELQAFAVCEVGRGWRLKAAPMDSIVVHFVLQGEGLFDTPDGAIALKPNTVVIVPAGSPENFYGPGEAVQEASAAQSCKPLSEGLVSFSAHGGHAALVLGCASLSATYGAGQRLFGHLNRPLAVGVDGNRLSAMTFECLLEEISSPGVATTSVVEALMKQILVLMLRDHLQGLGVKSPFFITLGDARLLRAVSAIIAHPEQPHSLASLAAIAGMSRSSFAARFSRVYDRTPADLLQEVRLRAAARMLAACELPVKVVAANVGYSSRSHFSRAFKSRFGSDPSSYRDALIMAKQSSPAQQTFRLRMDDGLSSSAVTPMTLDRK